MRESDLKLGVPFVMYSGHNLFMATSDNSRNLALQTHCDDKDKCVDVVEHDKLIR